VTASERSEPLVAVVSQVPLLSEALTAALEGIARVRRFPAGQGDTIGLLRALAPDAVVVDSDAEAREAEAFARETQTPAIHVSVDEEILRTFEEDRWYDVGRDASPEAIRNAVVGGIYGREHVK
jgi:hypothetical protein